MSTRLEELRGMRRRKRRAGSANGAETEEGAEGGKRRRPRTGAKRTVMAVIRQIPDYLRLLFGLLRDRRVSGVDKLLVAGAIAYIVSPVDLIPDVIPFLGQVDDVFLLTTALERLVRNAGAPVLRRHWRGDPADLSIDRLRQVVAAAAFFLPGKIKRRLRR